MLVSATRMQPLSRADRICAVSAAAAHDLNDELTVIVSAAAVSLQQLPVDHPCRGLLRDIREAANRCAWKSTGLLHFAARNGVRPSAVTLEELLCDER